MIEKILNIFFNIFDTLGFTLVIVLGIIVGIIIHKIPILRKKKEEYSTRVLTRTGLKIFLFSFILGVITWNLNVVTVSRFGSDWGLPYLLFLMYIIGPLFIISLIMIIMGLLGKGLGSEKLIWSIFWILVLNFVFFAIDFIPAVAEWPFKFGPLCFALFLLLGIPLLILTIRGKVVGLLRKFLLLTASASFAIPVSYTVLNMVFSPQIVNIIDYIIQIAFLVGVVGSIVLARRQSKQAALSS